jgi:hypothetical protein
MYLFMLRWKNRHGDKNVPGNKATHSSLPISGSFLFLAPSQRAIETILYYTHIVLKREAIAAPDVTALIETGQFLSYMYGDAN